MAQLAPLTAIERRSVAALLVTAGCLSTASMAGTTALGKQVYDLTRDARPELALGLLGLAEFAPAALLVLVTGTVADRHSRKRIVALSSWAEACCAVALAWYASTEPTAALPIFFMVIAFGIARAFVAPAERSLPADIVDADRLPWLVPRFSGIWQVSLIAGPVLGGTLYAIDPTLPYVAMASLLAIGALTALLIQTPHATPRATIERSMDANENSFSEALAGLRFIRGHAVVLGAISLDLFAVLFGGAIALLPVIADQRLHVGAVGLGWLRAAGGIGAALATFGLAVRPLRRHVGRTLLFVVALFGLFTIVLGLTHSYAVAFLAILLLSAADAVSVFIRATLVPLATPADRRGRVLAVENVFIGASNELGAFESGVVGQLIGASAAIALGGVATLAVALTWWRLFPSLRDVDRFPEPIAGVPTSPLTGPLDDLPQRRGVEL